MLDSLLPRAGRSITWLIFLDDDGRWHAHATVNGLVPETLADPMRGAFAIDVNVGSVTGVLVDDTGNAVTRHTFPFPRAGTPSGVAAALVGDSAKVLRPRVA